MIWLCVHAVSDGLRPEYFFTACGKRPDYPSWKGDRVRWNTTFHGTGNYVLQSYKTEALALAGSLFYSYTDDDGILQWARHTTPELRAFK